MKTRMMTIENKVGKVKLDDTVDEYSRRKLAEEMAKVFGAEAFANPEFTNLTNSKENEVDRLEIEINSPGGSVMDGLLIVNELRAMSARGVRTVAIVNVLAASMGSVIAASCDECLIAENGRMMIHDVSVGVRGTAKDLQRMAALCEDLSNEIAAIYAKKTGGTVEAMRSLMLDETWMDAEKCIALGFADGPFDFRGTAANIAPVNYLQRITQPSQPESIERITELESTIADRDAAIAAMSAKISELEAAAQEAITAKALMNERINDLQNELSQTAAQLSSARHDIEIAETAIAELKSEMETTIADHAAELQEAMESAAARAAEIAAEAGFEKPLPIGDGEPPTDHLAVLAKLNGAERSRYYTENTEAIRQQIMRK